MSKLDDLLEENQILRERIGRLEAAAPDWVDPMLRAFIEHAPAFLTVITPAGRHLATGRTSEGFGSVIGRSVFEFVEPSQHAVMRDAFARVCETRKPVIYESIGYGENGEPSHAYLVRAVPVLDNDVVSAIALIPTDITERVNLARSLAQSEQKLRFAVAASRMGLWSWDTERDQVAWDERAMEIFGARTAPANYAQYLTLIHPDDHALVKKVVISTMKTGAFQPFEHRLAPRPDGIERWVLGTGTVLPNESGKWTLLMGGALDITEQKRAAAQLQRAQRVEALGQLTAGLAHNFNNLLVAIIPNLELALQQAAKDQVTPLTAAMDASLQARDLIKRLMSITGQRPTGITRSSDPRQVVERAVSICRSTFPREIEVRLTLDPNVGHVGIDASDLDQVVLNLMFNARDALERTAGRERLIEVTLDGVPAPGTGKQVRLRVRDTGPGMSREVQARVFEPFFTTKPAQRGSGLGLADALVRVRAADGQLECRSNEGEGATFTLLLPETPAPAAVAASPAIPGGSRGETILLVDDESAVRTVVARLLKQQGYRILQAQNAEEARTALLSHGGEIKLVLLDQSMPCESGTEALPSLKRLSDAPVVIFTGGAAELPPGAAALLEKPATAADLLRTVREVIVREPQT